MTKPEEYYAAAILLYARGTEAGYVSEQSLKTWGIDAKNDFGVSEFQAYLKDEATYEKSIELLERDKLLVRISDTYGPSYLSFSNKYFIDDFESGEPDSVIAKTAIFGKDWIFSALLNLNDSLDISETIEAELLSVSQVSKWEPLPINRDSSEFSESLEELEKHIQVIATDNGYAANEPDERNAIVETSKGMVAALKDGTPDKRSVKVILVDQFKYLAKRYAETTIGEAAKAVWKIASAWLTGS